MTMTGRGRRFVLAAPVLAAGLALAACGSSGSGTAAGNGSGNGNSGAAAVAGQSPGGAAAAGALSITVTDGHLTDGTGRAVYLWTADHGGKSVCSGACAGEWPPVSASAVPAASGGVAAGKFATIKRSDGTSQLSYAGHPLYYFDGDSGAGSTAGQGLDSFGGKWWLVAASGSAVSAAPAAASSAPAPASSAGGNPYHY